MSNKVKAALLASGLIAGFFLFVIITILTNGLTFVIAILGFVAYAFYRMILEHLEYKDQKKDMVVQRQAGRLR